MSDFVVYVKLPPFVSQFLVHSLGNPVVFPPQSIENSTIRVFISKLPEGKVPETSSPELTAIAIPDSKSKPAVTFNYLSPRGKKAIVECCDLLFNRCLWTELGDSSNIGCKILTAIYAWCELHGIDIDYADTIRQRYYRIRDNYAKRGIDLMKKTREKRIS